MKQTMFRRPIAILLLPSLLLPPAATLGHTHQNGPPADHARPHLHLARQTHGHHHGPHGHRHDADANVASVAATSRHQDSQLDHDEYAIFFTVDALERSPIGAEAAASLIFLESMPPLFLASCPAHSSFAQRPHPPPSPHPNCPRFLRHLALLI